MKQKNIKKINYLKWEDFEKELFKQPRFKEAVKETELEYKVAHAIIEARVKKGLTQQKLARVMHTKQSVISRAESARSLPSLSFLKRLALALDATLLVDFKI